MRGRKRWVGEPKKYFTETEFLELLKAGTIISAAFIAPNVLKTVRWNGHVKKLESYYPSSISRAANRLFRKGVVNVVENSDGFIVTLSNKGKKEVLQFDIDAMHIEPQDPWDGKWRMVFFDIDEGEKKMREALRERLKAMGFYQMQKSVYIHPFPCTKQIAYLREVFCIPHSVKLAVVESLENDDDLRKIYRLF